MSSLVRRVAYIHQDNLQLSADALPSNIGRSSLVHSLIKSLNLLELVDDDEDIDTSELLEDIKECSQLPRARVVESEPASRSQLSAFHDTSYLGEFFYFFSFDLLKLIKVSFQINY